MSKSVHRVAKAVKKMWVGDGFHVTNAISYNDLGKFMNPFVWLDNAEPRQFEPSPNHRRGIGFHPHRGIDTVTIALQGEVTHEDRCGKTGTIGSGSAQWMRAGKGIEHAERHSKKFSQEGGTMEMLQLWVNLPKKHKMTEPSYQAIEAETIPQVEIPNGHLKVVGGEYDGTKGPAITMSPLNIFNGQVRGATTIKVPEGWPAAVFVYKGEAKVNGEDAKVNDLIVMEREGTDIDFADGSNAHFLVLSGEPLDEPVVGKGPMVMNTQEEIKQAFADYKKGVFKSNDIRDI